MLYYTFTLSSLAVIEIKLLSSDLHSEISFYGSAIMTVQCRSFGNFHRRQNQVFLKSKQKLQQTRDWHCNMGGGGVYTHQQGQMITRFLLPISTITKKNSLNTKILMYHDSVDS